MSMFRTSALSLAATVALGLATFTFVMPAHAATPAAPAIPVAGQIYERLGGEPPVVRVSYADLDLTTEQGRAAMRHRLARAANMVCDEANTISDPLKARTAYMACREEALDRAITYFAAKVKEKQLAQR